MYINIVHNLKETQLKKKYGLYCADKRLILLARGHSLVVNSQIIVKSLHVQDLIFVFAPDNNPIR